MRKLFPILACLLLISFSCKQEKVVDYALISGQITNAEGEFKLLSKNDRSFSIPIALSEDGNFKDTLRIDEGYYLLHDGKTFAGLYIEDGMDIHIEANGDDFNKTLRITGKGSEISNYYIEKAKLTNQIIGNESDFNKLGEEAHKAKAKELKTALEKLLANFEGVSENFEVKELRDLHYTYLKQLDYELAYRHYAEDPDFKISEGYLSEMDDVDYENEDDFNFSMAYKQIVAGHFREKATKLAESKSIPNDIAYIETVGDIKSEKIKNELLFSASKNSITYTEDLERFYNAFMAVSTDDEHKVEITLSYNQLKKLLKGSPSPKFIDYENYKGGTTSLDDLNGKYIYIDVWATWCGPCIAEIPDLKRIEKEYHGKNIEFVSLSVDKAADYDKWRQMIDEKNLGGIQLIADNNIGSEFIQDYLIKAIPRFILIDPNGDIVESNAPRPSDPKLIELFKRLSI